jgi:hypothetical protein
MLVLGIGASVEWVVMMRFVCWGASDNANPKTAVESSTAGVGGIAGLGWFPTTSRLALVA